MMLIVVMLIAIGTILILLVVELRRLIKELTYINTHDTNAELTTATGWRLVRQLSAAINHNIQENRRLRERQARQDAQVHQLLTNLTHDIKTPLTVAAGYVQLLQQQAPEDDRLLRVSHNLTTVNYYLHYLMDFNLIREQEAVTLAKVDLTQLVEEELFDAYDQLTAKNLTLTPKLPAHLEIITDPNQVRRVIQNLISNWLKYADREVAVTLTRRDAIHVDLAFANRTTADLPAVDRLVERFYTADPARQDSTGLGLSIVAALMVKLNGTLSLSSESDWFTATLTFRQQAQ